MYIWTLGDAVVDLLPLANMQYDACVGGAPVNVAAGVARLGLQSGFIGRVGDDAFGQFLHRTITEFGVNTQRMEFDAKHHTSTVLVSLDEQGERHFDFLVNPSADQFLTTSALPDFHADILHFCSLALVASSCRETLETAMQQVHCAGGLLSFDINLRAQMWPDEDDMLSTISRIAHQADILKMSEEEWYWLTDSNDFQTAQRRLESFPAPLKLVTYGANGAIVFWQGKMFYFSGYKVKSVDATGAGDAFMSGLLAAVAEKGWPDKEEALFAVIAQASACGALATTQKGALKATPNKQTLQCFMQSQPIFDVEIGERK